MRSGILTNPLFDLFQDSSPVTREQIESLANPEFKLFVGPAGNGKTHEAILELERHNLKTLGLAHMIEKAGDLRGQLHKSRIQNTRAQTLDSLYFQIYREWKGEDELVESLREADDQEKQRIYERIRRAMLDVPLDYIPCYEAVLIDEFQDIPLDSHRALQRILQSMSPRLVIAAGDENQFIYHFTEERGKKYYQENLKVADQFLTGYQVEKRRFLRNYRCPVNIQKFINGFMAPVGTPYEIIEGVSGEKPVIYQVDNRQDARRALRERVQGQSVILVRNTRHAKELLALAKALGVKVMTIHQAKGKTIDNVIIHGFEHQKAGDKDFHNLWYTGFSRARERLTIISYEKDLTGVFRAGTYKLINRQAGAEPSVAPEPKGQSNYWHQPIVDSVSFRLWDKNTRHYRYEKANPEFRYAYRGWNQKPFRLPGPVNITGVLTHTRDKGYFLRFDAFELSPLYRKGFTVNQVMEIILDQIAAYIRKSRAALLEQLKPVRVDIARHHKTSPYVINNILAEARASNKVKHQLNKDWQTAEAFKRRDSLYLGYTNKFRKEAALVLYQPEFKAKNAIKSKGLVRYELRLNEAKLQTKRHDIHSLADLMAADLTETFQREISNLKLNTVNEIFEHSRVTASRSLRQLTEAPFRLRSRAPKRSHGVSVWGCFAPGPGRGFASLGPGHHHPPRSIKLALLLDKKEEQTTSPPGLRTAALELSTVRRL